MGHNFNNIMRKERKITQAVTNMFNAICGYVDLSREPHT